MELKKGQAVRSRAGHDTGDFLIVLETDGKTALVCDGKRRKLCKPKRKKLIHLAPANAVFSAEKLTTDRQIRKTLEAFGKTKR